jgi:SAM-dependent methyltransferase
MTTPSPDRIEQHNRAQRSYFGGALKKSMVPTATPYILRQIDQLVTRAALKPRERILEVGCGMGRYTLPLLERGFRVDGLDLSPHQIDRLREFDGGRFAPELFCADVIDHPAEMDGRYDALIGFFTLHHLHDLTASFAAMQRMLKPGGRIAFLEPNAFNPLYYLQITFTPGMTWQGDGGIVKMRPGVVYPAMRAAGFERLAAHAFGFFPPFIANRRFAPPVEDALARLFGWTRTLPFQIFSGVKA